MRVDATVNDRPPEARDPDGVTLRSSDGEPVSPRPPSDAPFARAGGTGAGGPRKTVGGLPVDPGYSIDDARESPQYAFYRKTVEDLSPNDTADEVAQKAGYEDFDDYYDKGLARGAAFNKRGFIGALDALAEKLGYAHAGEMTKVHNDVGGRQFLTEVSIDMATGDDDIDGVTHGAWEGADKWIGAPRGREEEAETAVIRHRYDGDELYAGPPIILVNDGTLSKAEFARAKDAARNMLDNDAWEVNRKNADEFAYKVIVTKDTLGRINPGGTNQQLSGLADGASVSRHRNNPVGHAVITMTDVDTGNDLDTRWLEQSLGRTVGVNLLGDNRMRTASDLDVANGFLDAFGEEVQSLHEHYKREAENDDD